MKYALLLVGLLALMALSVNADLSHGNYGKPDQPGKCFLDSGKVLNIGEVINGPGCTRTACLYNGYVVIATCDVNGIGPPCRMGAIKYPDADYPKCCENFIHCPNGDTEM